MSLSALVEFPLKKTQKTPNPPIDLLSSRCGLTFQNQTSAGGRRWEPFLQRHPTPCLPIKIQPTKSPGLRAQLSSLPPPSFDRQMEIMFEM